MLDAPSDAHASVSAAFVEASLGEWAGWQCEFQSDGALIPVEDRYLDAATIEWGMQPAGFELLCTATVEDGALHQRFLRILPEVGCACTNVSAEMSVSRDSLDSLDARVRGDATLRIFTLDDPPSEGEQDWHLRTCFESWTAEGARLRTRLSLQWDATSGQLAPGKRARVEVERRWADSGALVGKLSHALSPRRPAASGLDAAFVTETINAPCFASSGGAAVAEANGCALPGGISFSAEPCGSGSVLVVRFADGDGAERVVRREFAGAVATTIFERGERQIDLCTG
eukprot:TRINITY_DN57021_c0_g1_i1.p1 TRINITY_DN57021_c0_g1~~TRINITY_DN57021_c0_g1_i1.p1  ORF type:complete len:286 (+),score=66.38 TRINITY_DN57021_c0_g1_i1:424-1281(+)